MKSFKRAIAFTATAASLLAVSAASLAAGGATVHAAVTAAQSDYRNAVARCVRMNGGEQRRCMHDAEAVRKAAMIRAQDVPGDANLIDLNFLPAAEGAPGKDSHDQGTRGGSIPTYRKLPDVQLVPDNLASNAAR